MLFFFSKEIVFLRLQKGEVAEWSNAAVLKTVDLHGSGGSNPSLSAKQKPNHPVGLLFFTKFHPRLQRGCFISGIYNTC